MALSNALRSVALVVIVVVALIGFQLCTYTINEYQQAILTQFGKPVGQPITTAGLHFSREIFEQIQAKVVEITLHVGYGTFEPIRENDLRRHRVEPEYFSINDEAARTINRAREAGGRVVAVGTTTTRALESSAVDGTLCAGSGYADLTILPGYDFRIVDALLTNFHLPRSSLLLLVSAFAGRELTLAAYRHAVRKGYRFYSYGNCMLIL